MEWILGLGAQHAQDPAGFKQRGAEPLGELAKRFAIADGTRLGDAIEIIRGNQLGMHGKGDRRRYIELIDLLTDITRDELDSRLHLWHHPLGFLDTFQAALAESFLLGHGANLLDVLLDIRGDELAVSAHPALEIDTMVVVANTTDTRLDLFALLSEPLVLTTSRFEGLLGVLQAHGFLWGAPWTALFGLITRVLRVTLQPFELLFGLGDGLVGRPFFGGHGTRNRFDQLVLDMEQVRRVMRLQIVFHIGIRLRRDTLLPQVLAAR